jgi:hypothetical protein
VELLNDGRSRLSNESIGVRLKLAELNGEALNGEDDAAFCPPNVPAISGRDFGDSAGHGVAAGGRLGGAAGKLGAVSGAVAVGIEAKMLGAGPPCRRSASANGSPDAPLDELEDDEGQLDPKLLNDDVEGVRAAKACGALDEVERSVRFPARSSTVARTSMRAAFAGGCHCPTTLSERPSADGCAPVIGTGVQPGCPLT